MIQPRKVEITRGAKECGVDIRGLFPRDVGMFRPPVSCPSYLHKSRSDMCCLLFRVPRIQSRLGRDVPCPKHPCSAFE
jgi:hypothetical protein